MYLSCVVHISLSQITERLGKARTCRLQVLVFASCFLYLFICYFLFVCPQSSRFDIVFMHLFSLCVCICLCHRAYLSSCVFVVVCFCRRVFLSSCVFVIVCLRLAHGAHCKSLTFCLFVIGFMNFFVLCLHLSVFHCVYLLPCVLCICHRAYLS